MNSKEAVIDKIMRDARTAAEANVKAAEDKCAAITDAAEAAATQFAAESKAKAERDAAAIIAGGKTVSGLDCRKALLSAKRRIADGVFAAAADAFRVKDAKTYKSALTKLIQNNAEDGDVVVPCEKDKAIVTDAFVQKIAKAAGKKLTLADYFADISGGVILSGEKCDKNLSVDIELEVVRRDCERQVLDVLFEEKG